MSRSEKDLRSLARHLDELVERGVVETVAAAAIANALRDLRHALRVGEQKRIQKAIDRLARSLVDGLSERRGR